MENSEWHELIGYEKRVFDATVKLFDRPTQIQKETIPVAIKHGKDILAKAQTGSGKTASYIIPILVGILRSPEPHIYKSLILVPTRDLCKQVQKQFDELSKFCHITASNLGEGEISTIRRALNVNPPAVLIGTPSRVLQLENMDIFKYVKFFVIDEADQQLGLDLSDEMHKIIKLLPANRQSYLMSATLDKDVESLTKLVLTNPISIDVTAEVETSLLSHFYIKVPESDKYLILYTLIRAKRIGKRILVFVNSGVRGWKLSLFLERFRIKSSVLNSRLPVASRIDILEKFNIGALDVLIAVDECDDAITDDFSASRGIDFNNLHTVVNFDIPTSFNQYVHRVGRTARGNREGTALTMIDDDTKSFPLLEQLAENHIVINPFDFDIADAEMFRYRVKNELLSVTKRRVNEAQSNYLKNEMINSEKMSMYFDANPEVRNTIKHDVNMARIPVNPAVSIIPPYFRKSMNQLIHPASQKIKTSQRLKRINANLDGLEQALSKYSNKKKKKGK